MGRRVRVGMAHLMTGTSAPACRACAVPLARRDHPLPALAAQGTWWDHPPLPGGSFGHTLTVLDPSPDLRAQLVEQAARSAGHVHPPLPVPLA